MTLIIGIILGIFAGYKANDLIKKLNEGIEIKLFGYNLQIGKSQKADIVQIDKKQQSKTKKAPAMSLDKNKCSTCNNEDMYIAGTKSLIPCPKCKKNVNKFKKALAK